ncbi:hypothetical protein [Bradyrhizobium sp.]|uniref:hypothetical protein n=1 Tax=Bradyrhizobium sp. TaxID=376 RepID=UPI003BAFCA9C
MRSPAGRRFRDLCDGFEHEAGGTLTETEKTLVRQAAAMTLQAEALQSSIVRGESVPAYDLIRLTSEARRILAPIVAKASLRKTVEPTLHDYLGGQAA